MAREGMRAMGEHPRSSVRASVRSSSSGFNNSGVVAHARLSYLGDVFAMPRGWPLANVFSVGDILLVVGTAVLLHRGSRVREVAACEPPPVALPADGLFVQLRFLPRPRVHVASMVGQA
jgi:hypothetical protein